MKTYHPHSRSMAGLLSGLGLVVLSSVPTLGSCVRDLSFNPGGSFTGPATVLCAAVQSDGKPIFGGYFTYNGNYPNGYPFTANNLVRFNTDGTVDTGFNPSPNNLVRAIIIQPDQKIIIGGHFTQVAGLTQTYISRLNTGGGPDYIGFQAPVPNNYVYALGRIGDGRVVVGGAFTTMAGFSYQHLCCLKVTGGLVGTFNPGVSGNAVWAIAVYPTNVPSADKVVIGGDFTVVGAYSRVNAARLDSWGSVDTTFDMGANVLNAPIYAVATDYGQFTTAGVSGDWVEKVYIGGAFTAPRNYFTRLAHAGYPDSNIEGAATDAAVHSIRIQANHGVLLGGSFTHAPWSLRNRLARFYPGSLEDGSWPNDLLYLSTWSDCDPNNGASSTVNAVAISPSGQVYVGGSFTSFEGLSRQCVARLLYP